MQKYWDYLGHSWKFGLALEEAHIDGGIPDTLSVALF